MRVRAIPKERLRDLAGEDWIDRTRSFYAEGNIVWVPVREDEPCEREIHRRKLYQGTGFFMLGDIAVIHGKKPTLSDVEELVSYRHPRGVIWIRSLWDVTRIPETEILWGSTGDILHKENGYTYVLDPTKVMFAQGNRNEKMRIARQIRDSDVTERVADMYAGIGYFTIPIAGSGAFVHALEINPVAFDYLQKNVQINNLSSRIDAARGDCRNLLIGTYDRIVMGHFDALSVLPLVLSHVRTGSIIHLHSLGAVADTIREVTEGAGFSATIDVHKVKKYRPHVWHVVQDVTLS